MPSKRKRQARSLVWLYILVGLVTFSIFACVGIPAIARSIKAHNEPVVLNVAYSPEKEQLFTALVKDFAAGKPRIKGGRPIKINATRVEPDAMIEAALAGQYQAISPDSSIWLLDLDQARATQGAQDSALGFSGSLVGETTRYAVSPVVVAMWEDTARSIGYPNKALGWQDVLNKARSDPNFKWSHASTSTASGLLATLAEFYAAAGKTRGLSKADATAQATLDYVGALEKTVRHYGEGEYALIQQMLQNGSSYLDAVVVQEQLVINFNSQNKGRLIAIYPTEGALWEDHPLALLEQPDLTTEQRYAYAAFRDYLLSSAAQTRILHAGYRPVDLSLSLNDAASPIKTQNGVDPLQPKTVLQVPGAGVLQVVRDVWAYTKRKSNVYLVADVSGSMNSGSKLVDAQQALTTFLGQIPSDQERVGLISFSSSVREVVPLGELKTNRQRLIDSIDNLQAGGNTALVDAVDSAYQKLQALKDTERINAIVVMTDGQENNSKLRLAELVQRIQAGNKQGVQVVIFCIAYGSDADMKTMQTIAGAAEGQARKGDLDTIKQLYKTLSTYF